MKVRLTITAEPADELHCEHGWPPSCQYLDRSDDWCLAFRAKLDIDGHDPARRHDHLRCPECLAGEVVE